MNTKLKRIAAYVIDLIALGFINGIVMSYLGFLGVIGFILTKFLYDPLFHLIGWKGQSLGKKLLGLRVVKSTGQLTLADLAVRSFLRFCMLTALISFILWLVEKETLHDKIVKTRVVEE
ncbi:MAG: RDD family protein [Candidatus Micrarchaeota archaeon]|nr:RDD family protein [Candidatus Micrarchaeota archaeon]